MFEIAQMNRFTDKIIALIFLLISLLVLCLNPLANRFQRGDATRSEAVDKILSG